MNHFLAKASNNAHPCRADVHSIRCRYGQAGGLIAGRWSVVSIQSLRRAATSFAAVFVDDGHGFQWAAICGEVIAEVAAHDRFRVSAVAVVVEVLVPSCLRRRRCGSRRRGCVSLWPQE
jgi:hypothetical protein